MNKKNNYSLSTNLIYKKGLSFHNNFRSKIHTNLYLSSLYILGENEGFQWNNDLKYKKNNFNAFFGLNVKSRILKENQRSNSNSEILTSIHTNAEFKSKYFNTRATGK